MNSKTLMCGGVDKSCTSFKYQLIMARKIRAKFSCNSIDENGIAHLSAVYGTDDKDNEENNQFAEATPYGELQMQVDNPDAKGFLQPGKDYYLDFTEVTE